MASVSAPSKLLLSLQLHHHPQSSSFCSTHPPKFLTGHALWPRCRTTIPAKTRKRGVVRNALQELSPIVQESRGSLFLVADTAGYSLASYYTSLGLFVISVPGLWSLIKRSVKSKVKLPNSNIYIFIYISLLDLGCCVYKHPCFFSFSLSLHCFSAFLNIRFGIILFR